MRGALQQLSPVALLGAALHLVLAVGALPAGFLLAAAAFEPFSPWVAALATLIALIYATAPILSYAADLVFGARAELPEHEPCARTGQIAGMHWFEFASLPDSRLWTADPAQAEAIRQRPQPATPADFSLTIRQAPQAESTRHAHAWMTAMLTVTGSMVFGYGLASIMGIVGFTLLGDAGNALSHFITATVLALFYAAFALLPSLLAFWGVYGTVLWFGAPLLRRVLAPRRTPELACTRHQLRTDAGTVDLDDPDTNATLHHSPFGTTLHVANDRQAVDVHGDWAQLQPLANHLADHERSSPQERDRVRAALNLLHEH